MKGTPIITTSWDDGHPLDLRLADLLEKHGMSATFYIPRSSQRPTMTARQIRALAERFEIGGHTLDHIELTKVSEETAGQEIAGCKAWLEDVTGRPCRMFCPPLGRFWDVHLRLARDAGFGAVRTVEFLSTRRPVLCNGLYRMATSAQAHPQRATAIVKNALRRHRYRNLLFYALNAPAADWPDLADVLLRRALRVNGVFHLWGHSWELEQAGQWKRLDDFLGVLARTPAERRTNWEVCRSDMSGEEVETARPSCRMT